MAGVAKAFAVRLVRNFLLVNFFLLIFSFSLLIKRKLVEYLQTSITINSFNWHETFDAVLYIAVIAFLALIKLYLVCYPYFRLLMKSLKNI